jgi:hypothetical protein
MKPALLLVPLLATACTFAPPRPPAAGDVPGYTVVLPAFSLIGNELTPGDDTITLEVVAPPGTESVRGWMGETNRPLERVAGDPDVFRVEVDVRKYPPGAYRVLLAANGDKVAFAERTVFRTHPLYVVTTTDWDTPDNPDENLERHAELHRRHPELKITHLVGPYTFTDLSLSPARAEELAAWCRSMRDTHGDEIGVHIHPYRSLVEAVEADFHDAPTGLGTADPTGYAVFLSVYEEDELTRMLELTTALFEENGLGRPTSFRAGAWNADGKVMRALARAGYRVDTSALNVSRLEEWEGSPLHAWVSERWSTITDTSQPYLMNTDDPASSAPPRLPVLQVPDNGALVDYVTGAEMIEVFRANWHGGWLNEPRVVSIGWHPPNYFGERYFERIDEALTELDRYLASEGNGPVIYANLGEMAGVWRAD